MRILLRFCCDLSSWRGHLGPTSVCRRCVFTKESCPAPSLPHGRGFPARGVLSRDPTSTVASAFLWMVLSVGILDCTSRPRWISQVPLTLPWPRVPCPETPPDSPAAFACSGCLLMAFHVFERVGVRAFITRLIWLHLRYGPRVALSTLHPCRYLHERKTRFPVGWLVPCRGGNDTRWKRRAWPGAPK